MSGCLWLCNISDRAAERRNSSLCLSQLPQITAPAAAAAYGFAAATAVFNDTPAPFSDPAPSPILAPTRGLGCPLGG